MNNIRNPKESRAMPNRDPSNWKWLVDTIPYLSLALVTFVVGFLNVLHKGGAWPTALMSATVGTILSLSLYPVFLWIAESFGWPSVLAFATSTFLAFMGVEWIRNKADELYEMLINRWIK